MVMFMEANRIFVTLSAAFTDEERCRVAMEKIVSDAHAAYGVNSHFWFRSEDGKSLYVLEQYEDKMALRKAIMRFTSARFSFFRSIAGSHISIYGSVATSSKLMFAAMRPQYMEYFGGFAKGVDETKEAGIKDFERSRILVVTSARVKDEGKCRAAMQEITADAHAESGTKSHYWCRGGGGQDLHVLEQYADEGALVDHLNGGLPAQAAFLDSVDVVDATVYGNVSGEVEELFASLDPTFMGYYGGYSK